MRVRAAVAATIAGMCVVAPADAAPSSVVRFTDAADDANALNDQNLCRYRPLLAVTSCPPEVKQPRPHGNVEPAADIRSVTVATTYATKRTKDRRGRTVTRRLPSGYRVEFLLSAPPEPGHVYWLNMVPLDCTIHGVAFRWYPTGQQETQLRHDCGGDVLEEALEPAEVTGSKIVVTVTAEQAYVEAPTAFTNLYAFTRTVMDSPTGWFQAAQLDHAETTAQFRYG